MFPYDIISFEVFLPFMLVLAIIYGALEVSKVFKNRAVKGIIAMVFAFFAVMNSQVVAFINAILPYAAAFFVVIFIIWIVLKPIRGEKKPGEQKNMDSAILLIVILVLVLVLLARMSVSDYWPESSLLSNSNLIWIIGIAIAAVILWKAYKIGSG